MTRLVRPLLAAVAAIGLATCVPTYGAVYTTTYVDAAPPEPLVEVAPPAPSVSYAWVNGYWYWNGVTYVWVRGYWAPRPVAGYVWVPSGWVVVGGRYEFLPGRWSAPEHRRQVRYVHPPRRVHVVAGARYRTQPGHRPPHKAPPRGRPHGHR